MIFVIDVDGRTRHLSVEPTDREGRFRVALDGGIYDVEARRSSDVGLLLVLEPAPQKVAGTFPSKVPATSADKPLQLTSLESPMAENPPQKVPATFSGKVPATYHVFVAPTGRAGEVMVTLAGRTATVTINGKRDGRPAEAAGHADGEQSVVAPMPGRVVRVLVERGDEVAARQGVVVVEAMKMENELRAPKRGRVKDVSVSAGTSVEAGRVLVVIE
jgi:biotin carboxyl carrier protein